MRVTVFAVGRMKSGPERELADRYFDRFAKVARSLGLEFAGVSEIAESRAPDAGGRKTEEAAQLLQRMPVGAAIFALDENGSAMTSEKFASAIAALRDDGTRDLAMAIGGPDGHGQEVLDAAGQIISFGAMTWPHQIVRILAAEQLYRAATILSGHPYHRS